MHKIFSPRTWARVRGLSMLAALFLVVGVLVLVPKLGCACAPPVLEDPPPEFTFDDVSGLVGLTVRTKGEEYTAVYNPYASVVLPANTAGQVVTYKEIVYSDTGERHFEVTVAYEVRPGRIDTADYDRKEFLELFPEAASHFSMVPDPNPPAGSGGDSFPPTADSLTPADETAK